MQRLLVIIFFTLSIAAFGQPKSKHTITLNDGSQISGTIVSDSSGTLKIEVFNPQILTFEQGEIAKVGRYKSPNQLYARDKGYYANFSSSILSGKNSWGNVYSLSFLLSNGYQFSNGFSMGFGSGFEHLGISLLPVYGEVKYFTLNGKLSPFAYLKCGYSFAVHNEGKVQSPIYYDSYYQPNDTKGDIMFNVGLGLANFTWQKAAVTIALGYRFQRVTEFVPYYWWGNSTKEVITEFNRIELQLGFIFR